MQPEYLSDVLDSWSEPAEAVIVESPKEKRHWTYRLSLALAVIAVIALPLFFGGKNEVLVSVVKFSIFALLMTLATYFLVNERPTGLVFTLGYFGRICLLSIVAFSCLVCLQLVALPHAVVSLLSSLTAEAYMNAEASGTSSLSLEVFSSISHLSWFIAVALFGLLLIALPREDINTRLSRNHKSRKNKNITGDESYRKARAIDYVVDVLQRAIVASGALCSVIALGHLITDKAALFGLFEASTIIDSNRAHWPFPNPNHLAVFLEIAVITAFSRFLRVSHLAEMKRVGNRGVRHMTLKFLRNPEKLGANVLQLLVIFVMILATVLSLSRMGNSLLILGLLVLWWSFENNRQKSTVTRQMRRGENKQTYGAELARKIWLKVKTPLLVLSVATFVLFFIGQGGRDLLTKRIEYGLAIDRDIMRMEMAAASIAILANYPLLGVGFGCWHLAVVQYIPVELAGWTMDFAHNEYLQVFAETGALGACVVLWFLYSLFRYTRRAMNTPLFPAERIHLIGSSLAVLLPLLHCLVDYPLHIPATAVVFVVALAVHIRIVDKCISRRPM